MTMSNNQIRCTDEDPHLPKGFHICDLIGIVILPENACGEILPQIMDPEYLSRPIPPGVRPKNEGTVASPEPCQQIYYSQTD
jgi:hypothetical protein